MSVAALEPKAKAWSAPATTLSLRSPFDMLRALSKAERHRGYVRIKTNATDAGR